MTRPLQRRFKRGMSLIEVMVAGALLAIGMTAILSSFSTYSKLIAHQRMLMDAAFVAQSELQRLQSLKPAHTDLTPGVHGTLTVDANNQLAANGRYALKWTVTKQKPTPRSTEIRVVVTFEGDRQFELVGLQP